MTVPLYYAVRITLADKDNVSREVMRVDSVEQLNDRTHNIAPFGAKVETKYLGQGEPIYESRSPLRKRFHTTQQMASYEAGLMGHGIYPLDQGPLDNFNYMGEQDAEILWDVKHDNEGDEK